MDNSMEEYDMERTCRSCLVHSNNLNSVFTAIDNVANNTASLVEIIMECTQIKIVKDDGLPCNICRSCKNNVMSAYAYKKKCQESDLKLRTYLSKRYPHVQIKVEELPIPPPPPQPSSSQSSSTCKNLKTESAGTEHELIIADNSNNDEADNIKNVVDDDDDVAAYVDDADADNDYDNDDPNDSDYEYILDDEKFSMKKGRNDSNQDIFECPDCGKLFQTKRALQVHSKLHRTNSLHRCHTCNKDFSRKYHLNRHMALHLKKMNQEYKVYAGSHSGTRKKKRKVSNRTTSIDLPYYGIFGNANGIKQCTCKICNLIFTRIYSLRKHMAWHMKDAESFHTINLRERDDLFVTVTEPQIGTETDEQLCKQIQLQLKSKNAERFYQIINEAGVELTLSDSETDSEHDSPSNDEWKPKKLSYGCTKCGKLFDRKYKTILHTREEHYMDNLEFDHKCLRCDNGFPNADILRKHLKSQCENEEKQISCDICKMKFMWQNSYELHYAKYHSKGHTDGKQQKVREKSYSCDQCSKAFARHDDLERHRRVHVPAEKKFTCDICKKKFNRKDNLKSHMRVHKQEKETTDKHLCVYCGRSFSNSSNLIVHMRRHTGEKPYKCDFCDKGFPRSSDLQCHRRTHTGEKPCLCTICGKGFSRSNKLVRHMRIHTGVRPYKCPYCERAFTQSNDLTLHIRRHTGDKPYVCGVCGDRFIQGTALQTHRRVQGHFEENNPAPFASISAQNPSRYTNANRVNRIGFNVSTDVSACIKQETQKPSTTVASGATAAAATAASAPAPAHRAPPLKLENQQSIGMGVQHSPPTSQSQSQHHATIGGPSLSNQHHPAAAGGASLRMPNFPIAPSAYVPNGNPFLMQNMDMPSMFSIPPFPQNYN